MKKKKYKSPIAINKQTNVIFNIILILIVIASLFPLIYVFSISISSKESISKYGYQLIPKEVTFQAYNTLLKESSDVLRAFKNSLILTLVGTISGLVLTTTFAYATSRNDFKYKRFFNTVAFIPMLFGGGMVANYIVMTRVLMLRNTFWALYLPLLLNTFYVVVMRTFFQTSVPTALIEAAKIDGANEFQIFFKIVLPISLPGIATIGLFLTLAYWNDWFNAMMYLDQNSPYTTMQYLLMKIQVAIEAIMAKKSMMGSVAQEALDSLPQDAIKMAIVVLTTLPIALSYPFFQRYFIEGLTLGAVKE